MILIVNNNSSNNNNNYNHNHNHNHNNNSNLVLRGPGTGGVVVPRTTWGIAAVCGFQDEWQRSRRKRPQQEQTGETFAWCTGRVSSISGSYSATRTSAGTLNFSESFCGLSGTLGCRGPVQHPTQQEVWRQPTAPSAGERRNRSWLQSKPYKPLNPNS